jgi:hypothetical protein
LQVAFLRGGLLAAIPQCFSIAMRAFCKPFHNHYVHMHPASANKSSDRLMHPFANLQPTK